MSRNVYKGIDNAIVRHVRFYARKLKRKVCFFNDELEDIEQELMLHVFEKVEAFEDSKGNLSTYVRSILDNKSKNWIKQKMRGKSECGGILLVPLDEVDIFDSDEMSKFFDKITLTDVGSRLPLDLVEIFQALRSHNITDAAVILGKSKSTLYKKMRQIRDLFSEMAQADSLHSTINKKEQL